MNADKIKGSQRTSFFNLKQFFNFPLTSLLIFAKISQKEIKKSKINYIKKEMQGRSKSFIISAIIIS